MSDAARQEIERLRQRLREAEAVIEALQGDEVDAVVSRRGVSLLRLKEMEDQLRRAHAELEQRVAERTTEVRRRADQLRALALQLTEAEERERRRLAVVLHDGLQQQLVAMRFLIETLADSLTDDSRRADADQLLLLAEEAIRASRSLSVELSPPTLYRDGLPAALRWLAATTEEKHGLTVELDIEADADPEGGRAKVFLFQAVRELLFNVVKHADTDVATVTLRQHGDEAELTVEDTGKGFDPESLHASSTAETGLGLVSILERAELIGVRVEIDSSPSAGTRVGLRWEPAAIAEPTLPPDRRREPPPAAAGLHEPLAATGEPRTRVLVVDDHAVLRRGLLSLLEPHDDIVVIGEASNGAEGVALARRLLPDVVLMDVAMPVLDGIEATRRITTEHPGIRVIALSMHETADTEARMLAAGADTYVSKAGSGAELVAAIRQQEKSG